LFNISTGRRVMHSLAERAAAAPERTDRLHIVSPLMLVGEA
jgi:hypothetical protein